jgi:hypothetical protein
MPRPFGFACASVIAAIFGGCSPSAPRLHQPDRIDAFCGDRAAIATAIESIVASTGDASGRTAVPPAPRIREMIKDGGGIIAHWNDQPLYSPSLAKVLGSNGDYVTLGDAAIPDQPANTDSRPIFLTLKTATGLRTFALRAYDVQDVCNQGKLSS